MPPIGPDDAARHPGQIGRASAALFTRLVDDASMFPPGNAPLEQAVQEHLGHRTAWYAGLVGPLVVRADHVSHAAEVIAAQSVSAPIQISVVAPEGLAQARDGIRSAGPTDRLDVVGVELPLDSVDDLAGAWSELGAGGRAVWWEIDRHGYLREQLGRLAGATRTVGSHAVGGAKLRTGGLDAAAVPAEEEVAAFLRHTIDLDLTFKLTAGLHHAVRRTDPASGLEQHGVLNLLCALKAALNGAEVDELAELLGERSADPLVVRADGMSEADASVIRAFWSSFGCCGVQEPIDELAGLGLVGADSGRLG